MDCIQVPLLIIGRSCSVMFGVFLNRRVIHLRVDDAMRLFWKVRRHRRREKRNPEKFREGPKVFRKDPKGVSEFEVLNIMY